MSLTTQWKILNYLVIEGFTIRISLRWEVDVGIKCYVRNGLF